MAKKVYILTTDRPDKAGGQERYISYLASGFARRGYDVTVFHRENTWPKWWPTPHPKNRLSWVLAGTVQGFFLGRAARRALSPEVELIISSSVAGWYPLPGGVRKAHLYHGTYWHFGDAIKDLLSPRGYRVMKWWSCQVLERLGGRGKVSLCNSDQTRSEVQALFGHPAKTVWCPMDLSHFSPRGGAESRAQLGLAEGRPVGLFVGYDHPLKGFPLVQELAERRSDIQWVWALRSENAPRWAEQFPKVKVIQNAPREMLPALYSAADFSLCPSRYESFGYVVAESLACGTPAIASPGGASLALMSEPPLDRLLIATPDDRPAFENAIDDVLRNGDAYREAVESSALPKLRALTGEEEWWSRFFRAAGLSSEGSARPGER